MSGLEVVAEGLSFPTSVTLDEAGAVYVAESGLPLGGAAPGGRIWRLDDGRRRLIVDGLQPPVNGLCYHDGALIVSEGGRRGRLSRVGLDGRRTTILDDLPGGGNYQTNMAVVGPDERIYFSQGAATNSGIVGPDAHDLAWADRLDQSYDHPGLEIVLTGATFETDDPRASGTVRCETSAFSPFGETRRPGARLKAELPCTAAIMSVDLDGRNLELVAWGLRNAFGVGFLPDGRLLAIDQGADDRGSRPVGDAPDLLLEIRPGHFYGWPDFIAGTPITDPCFHPQRGLAPQFLLSNHDELPPPECALAAFESHVAATKFTLLPDGKLVVALFGDERPLTAPRGERRGRSLAVVETADWAMTDLAIAGLDRPIDVCYDAGRDEILCLDFGRFEMTADGFIAAARSGTLARIGAESVAGHDDSVGGATGHMLSEPRPASGLPAGEPAGDDSVCLVRDPHLTEGSDEDHKESVRADRIGSSAVGSHVGTCARQAWRPA